MTKQLPGVHMAAQAMAMAFPPLDQTHQGDSDELTGVDR